MKKASVLEILFLWNSYKLPAVDAALCIDGEMFKSFPSYGKSSNISCVMNTAVKCMNKIRVRGLHLQEVKECY